MDSEANGIINNADRRVHLFIRPSEAVTVITTVFVRFEISSSRIESRRVRASQTWHSRSSMVSMNPDHWANKLTNYGFDLTFHTSHLQSSQGGASASSKASPQCLTHPHTDGRQTPAGPVHHVEEEETRYRDEVSLWKKGSKTNKLRLTTKTANVFAWKKTTLRKVERKVSSSLLRGGRQLQAVWIHSCDGVSKDLYHYFAVSNLLSLDAMSSEFRPTIASEHHEGENCKR